MENRKFGKRKVTKNQGYTGNFLASFLTDGVHLNDAANDIMADFMLSLLESKKKYKPLNLSNLCTHRHGGGRDGKPESSSTRTFVLVLLCFFL